jgi:hypothetical protein
MATAGELGLAVSIMLLGEGRTPHSLFCRNSGMARGLPGVSDSRGRGSPKLVGDAGRGGGIGRHAVGLPAHWRIKMDAALTLSAATGTDLHVLAVPPAGPAPVVPE